MYNGRSASQGASSSKSITGENDMNFFRKLIYIILTLAIHLMVLYDYWNGQLIRIFPKEWSEQFVIAVIIILLLSLLSPFIRLNWQRGIFFIRLFLITAISLPFVGNPGNFALLFVLQTFEGFFYFSNRTAIVFGCGYFLFLGGLT